MFAVGTIIIGSLRLSFWDLGGQEELQSLWHKYFNDSHALIFVVDSCDTDRFQKVEEAFSKRKNDILVPGRHFSRRFLCMNYLKNS